MSKQSDGQVIALYDLLSALSKDHFSRTAEGARRIYHDEKEQALRRMDEHYDSIAAGLNATIAIADTINATVESLWDSAT